MILFECCIPNVPELRLHAVRHVRAFDYQILKEQIDLFLHERLVELIGIEPTTSGLQSRRSPN